MNESSSTFVRSVVLAAWRVLNIDKLATRYDTATPSPSSPKWYDTMINDSPATTFNLSLFQENRNLVSPISNSWLSLLGRQFGGGDDNN